MCHNPDCCGPVLSEGLPVGTGKTEEQEELQMKLHAASQLIEPVDVLSPGTSVGSD